ncbi:MAG: hypothetical protein GY725_10200 [bacterium]|nr:hypothetical protein [bacterium]
MTGPNAVTLTIPQLHDVRVLCPDLELGTRVQLERMRSEVGDVTLEQRVGESRRVTFPDVVAGRYRLRARGSGSIKMELDVPCGEVVIQRE